jgi:hypothetical protein
VEVAALGVTAQTYLGKIQAAVLLLKQHLQQLLERPIR